MWDGIESMRKKHPAAVDTMGAGCIRDENADPNE
jgi:hypothetical protein